MDLILKPSFCFRWLCAIRWCNLYGAIDKTRMEFGIHSGSFDNANICDTCERQSTNTVWSNKSKCKLKTPLIYYLDVCANLCLI